MIKHRITILIGFAVFWVNFTPNAGRSQKPPPGSGWDVELRRLDAAMCRLRVRLERCQEYHRKSIGNILFFLVSLAFFVNY